MCVNQCHVIVIPDNMRNHVLLQSELFQDDLFPPTKVTWEATMTANEWLNNRDKKVKKISLQPKGMESCKYI